MLDQIELAALEEVIISASMQNNRRYRPWVVVHGYLVKSGSHRYLYPEMETLKYVSEQAKLDENAPRVPEVLHYFNTDIGMAYIVMDHINFTQNPVPDIHQRVALALQWLRDLPAPPGFVGFGPLVCSRVRHTLFQDSTAPYLSSIQALQRYLNKAVKLLQRHDSQLAPVNISEERLVFTQSDMDIRSFGVDDKGKTCLVDFRMVGLLPESFASYDMASTPFALAVADHLDWPSSPNLHSMRRISGRLWMTADNTLGLDENGYPKNR